MSSVLLMSGGLDSSALAKVASPDACLTIDYGQVAAPGELRASKAICGELGIPWHEVEIDCRAIGSGILAGTEPDKQAPVDEWWPYRNQLLVTIAAGWAISRGHSELLAGSVVTDQTHLDGTSEFYERLDHLVSFQEGSIRVTAPGIEKTTGQLLQEADYLKGLLGYTHSCHAGPYACGQCPGCLKRESVFHELRLV